MSFFTQLSPLADTSYGDRVVEIEWNGTLASDADVLRVVADLGLEEQDVELPYEYLSPELMDAPPERAETCRLVVEALQAEGYAGVRCRDFCCAESVCIFDEVAAKGKRQ